MARPPAAAIPDYTKVTRDQPKSSVQPRTQTYRNEEENTRDHDDKAGTSEHTGVQVAQDTHDERSDERDDVRVIKDV